MMDTRGDFKRPRCDRQRSSKHAPLSIPKLLTAVFAIASSSMAMVLGPQSGSSLTQRSNVLDDRSIHVDLDARATTSTSDDSARSTTARSSRTSTAVATSAASQTSSSVPSSAYTGLPQPFDTPLGSNFSSTTCQPLFKKIIADPAVRTCVPISLLLQGSRSFFKVESGDGLQRTVDISCNQISSTCNDLLQNYAASVRSANGCSAELVEQNQRVQYLFYGLISYLPVYSAACLQVSSTDTSSSTKRSYCFTSAANNLANSADLSLYMLPLGIPLADNATPSCSSCTQKAMTIFANAARNLTSPLSSNYNDAATQINNECGSSFVAANVDPIAGSNSLSGASTLRLRNMAAFGIPMVVSAMMLL